MNRILQQLTLALMLLLVTVISAPAQESNASLQESLDWLKGKLTENYRLGIWPSDYRNSKVRLFRFEPVRFDGCTLVWREQMSYTENKRSELIKRQIEINLADFDRSNIKVIKESCHTGNCWRIRLVTYNSKPLVKEIYLPENKNESNSSSTFIEFYASEQLMAQRIAKAFSHAITLCGGKKEPF